MRPTEARLYGACLDQVYVVDEEAHEHDEVGDRDGGADPRGGCMRWQRRAARWERQLDDGVCISNYALGDPATFVLNQKIASNATIQRADGTTYYVPTFVTPIGKTWLSPASNSTYFLQFQVDVPGFDASLVVTSLVDAQELPVSASPVYEGVASATGTFEGHAVSGTAWNEQAH